MRLELDGRSVEAPDGATVLEAAQVAGVEIPTLCWDERLAPFGSCRICLVGVGSGRSVPACTTPAAEGMAVRTDDPAATEAARAVLELLVSELPPRALELPPERSELVR